MALTYKIVDTVDILLHNDYRMRIGDLKVSGYNAGANTSVLISSAQGNLISDIVGFDPTFPDRKVFFTETTYGYVHILDYGLDGGSVRNLSFCTLTQSDVLAEIQPEIDKQMHIQGVRNFWIDGFSPGYIGHLYGIPSKFLSGRYGWRFSKKGSNKNVVSIKIDDGNFGWGIRGCEFDGAGQQYSAISSHKAGTATPTFSNIEICHNYGKDCRGEFIYNGSNSASNTQHGYDNMHIHHNLFVRGGLEIVQNQHSEGFDMIHHNVQLFSGMDREDNFQKFQDRNDQNQNIRSGQIRKWNNIYIGGGEFIFGIQVFDGWSGTRAERDVIYDNCFFGYGNNYFGFSDTDTTIGTRIENCFLKTGRTAYRYSNIYINEVEKNFALLFQGSTAKVTLKNNEYDTTNLRSGTAGEFAESGNTQGTVEDIQFTDCPIRAKSPGYDYSKLRNHNIEYMSSTTGGDTAFDNTSQGEPIPYQEGDIIFHKGRMVMSLVDHTPSNSPQVSDRYVDVAAMLAAQGSQTTGLWYRVNDARAGDPNISGSLPVRNYYKYLGTTNGDLTDYEPIILDYYANTADLIADQGSQITGKKYKAGTGQYAFYRYKGTTAGDLTDYDLMLGGLSTTLVTSDTARIRTLDFDSAKIPDVDIDFDTAVPDSNGETLGTYWKLIHFNNQGTWTQEIPDGGYSLLTGSKYELLDMGIKSQAQYRTARPDLLEWRRYLQDTGSPDLSTEIEIIGAEDVQYTPPTQAQLGVNAYYACFVTPKDKSGRFGIQTQINNKFILIE